MSTHSKTKWRKFLTQTFLIHLPQKLLAWMNQKHLVDSMKEAANSSVPKVDCREKADKVKIKKDTLKLIKEKRKLRRQSAKQKPPSTKSPINKMQKEISQKLNKETNTRWEKICNSGGLEKIPQNHGVG